MNKITIKVILKDGSETSFDMITKLKLIDPKLDADIAYEIKFVHDIHEWYKATMSKNGCKLGEVYHSECGVADDQTAFFKSFDRSGY